MSESTLPAGVHPAEAGRRVDPHRTVDAVWKLESAKIIGGLTRMVHDVGLAEELAQDALVAALEQWPRSGVPENPGAWLTAIAKRRAVDHIRRARRLDEKHHQLAHEQDQKEQRGRFAEEPAPDDALRLMFLSCHPVLPTPARVALTLRLLGGLTAGEIARAFLLPETTITRRIADAKRGLAEARVPFELPDDGAELADRLSSVLEVIYLIFNEGYSATSGDDLLRPGLTLEALRLGRLLAGLAPDEPEVHALAALMEIQESRSVARTGPSGEPVRLHEQNRGRWDPLLIRRGFAAMLRARDTQRGRPPGPYLLQAAIAVTHAQARTAEDTDWPQITALYEALERLVPSPVVRLNRAVALSMARGPGAGLALLDTLTTDPALRDYHLLPAARGDLLVKLGRYGEARPEFDRAAALTRNSAERAFLSRRAQELAPAGTEGPTLGEAATAFLARDGLGASTVRAYGQTLRRLCTALGGRHPLADLTADQITRTFTTAWGDAAAATWNRHRSAARSFILWASLGDLAAGLERRTEPPSRTLPIPPEQLAALWSRPGLPLREHSFWRLLHESGATVKAVLLLGVEDVDLDDRRARTPDGWVTWRSGTARLLPMLIADRTRGPLFLTDRRPGPGRRPRDTDLDPETGRVRLSYERAEYVFKRATTSLDPAGNGWTLSRLGAR
ncbi:sigma-70 family RNA polymerase sigma factor [Streptomyces sp. or20]|uniref:sigma-70 family RNA polymerase sigma factor n=1 Tax=Streptomyces sp. or20 TaxID=1828016 RepID=UPI000BF0A4E9|nr:sigma-70 family RNA polymerase sigma factor [Streptomyces sp. or20]